MAAEKAGAKRKSPAERLKRVRDALTGALKKARARLVKHPLCNLGLHKWQMGRWGRCTRNRCEVYRSFGKVAGVKEGTR